MHTLSAMDIGEFASLPGVNEKAVESFLYSVGQPGTKEGALLNLYYDARLYGWNISTVRAIEAGIQLAYAEKVVNLEATYDGKSTPLPGALYSLYPYSNR